MWVRLAATNVHPDGSLGLGVVVALRVGLISKLFVLLCMLPDSGSP